MQKLDLRKNLEEIIKKTKSKSIIDFFHKKEVQPGGYSDSLLNLIIDSKSGFDQAIINGSQNKILEQFNAHAFYSTKFHSYMMKFVS